MSCPLYTRSRRWGRLFTILCHQRSGERPIIRRIAGRLMSVHRSWRAVLSILDGCSSQAACGPLMSAALYSIQSVWLYLFMLHLPPVSSYCTEKNYILFIECLEYFSTFLIVQYLNRTRETGSMDFVQKFAPEYFCQYFTYNVTLTNFC